MIVSMIANTSGYTVVNIPLNRPEIVDFLLPPWPRPRGAQVEILGQRPTPSADRAWADRLATTPTVPALLSRDDPHGYLTTSYTDRLVPVEFLRDDPEFLTRNLGGWAPVYFGLMRHMALPEPPDPVLAYTHILTDYGERIRALGADAAQVTARLPAETGLEAAADVADAALAIMAGRERWLGPAAPIPARLAYLDRLYDRLADDSATTTAYGQPVPRALLLDELLGQLVDLEASRRAALAEDDHPLAQTIAAWQARRKEANGLIFILKGEYIMGRHRRSTVVILPELGVVVKQPAPEPLHEAHLAAVEHNGKAENWPTLISDGAMVTPGGRLRLILEEDLIPRLDRVFKRQVQFLSLLGLIVEPFETGPTLQQAVLADADRLTPATYETVMLHQQVCERLGVENGDWHSANFIVPGDDTADLVHIDWGAARPLRPDEMTPDAIKGRVQQVANIAYSFHDPALAARAATLHDALVADDDRMTALRRRADTLIRAAGLTPAEAP